MKTLVKLKLLGHVHILVNSNCYHNRYHFSSKELMDCLDYFNSLQNMFSLKTIVEPSQVASYHKRVPAHYYLSTR